MNINSSCGIISLCSLLGQLGELVAAITLTLCKTQNDHSNNKRNFQVKCGTSGFRKGFVISAGLISFLLF